MRELAGELKVSPATVAAAYRELRSRGIVLADGRRGTRIRDAPPIAARPAMTVPTDARNLASGSPDPDLLPPLPPIKPRSRLYGEPSIHATLASLARAQLAKDGIDATHLAVVAGALDGVERVLQAWLRPGDRVAIEDPGYGPILDLLAAMGLATTPIALDESGITPDSLARAMDGATALIATPRAQNPTGAAWDEKRTAELTSVLDAHPDVLIIEDDHAGPIAGAPSHTLCRHRVRWATVRSVSKALGPDLRLAVLAGDHITIARVQGRQALGTGWVSYILQELVADLWSDPATARLLRQAAQTYRRRRRALIDALAHHAINASGRSGLNAWITVPEEHALTSGLLTRGWAVAPGERFRLQSPPAIRIGIATLTEKEAPQLAADIAACMHEQPERLG